MKLDKTKLRDTHVYDTDRKAKRIIRLIPTRYITPSDIIRYFNSRANIYNPRTLLRDKTALKAYVKFNLIGNRLLEIYKWEILFKSIRTPNTRKQVDSKLVPKHREIEKISNRLYLDGYKEQAILLILLQTTGIRPGELIRIKLSDCIKDKTKINLNGKKRTIQYYKILIYSPKTKKNYVSIWSIDLYNIVNRFYRGKEYLIYNQNTNQRYYKGTFYKRFKIVKSYIPNRFYPYLLRHGYATNHYNRTKDIVSGSMLIGNTPETFVKSYVHHSINIAKTLEINKIKINRVSQ